MAVKRESIKLVTRGRMWSLLIGLLKINGKTFISVTPTPMYKSFPSHLSLLRLQVAHSKFETSTKTLLLFLLHSLNCSIRSFLVLQ